MPEMAVGDLGNGVARGLDGGLGRGGAWAGIRHAVELDVRLECTPFSHSFALCRPFHKRRASRGRRISINLPACATWASALIHGGVARKLEDDQAPPEVVMMEPPCLVVGRECNLDIHFCREVVVKNMEVTKDGELVNARRRATKKGKKIRLSIPPSEGCKVSVAVARSACPECVLPAMDVLTLPWEAAQEVCQLFERMVAGVQSCGGEAPPPELYGDQPDVPEASAIRTCPPRVGLWPREAAWAAHFRPFSLDFASVLQDLSSGSEATVEQRSFLAHYLLRNRLWSTASFLLTKCLSCGAPVTLGPFSLSLEDLEASRLRSDFYGGNCAAGVQVGQTVPEDTKALLVL